MQVSQTLSGTLRSGISYTVTRLKGIHQEWLTEGKGQRGGRRPTKDEKNLEHIMADVTTELGGIQNPNADDLKKLASWDFAELLLIIRYFTCDLHFEKRQAAYEDWQEKKERKDVLEKLGDERTEEEEDEFYDLQEVPDKFQDPFPKHQFKFNYEWTDKEAGKKRKTAFETELYFYDFPYKPAYKPYTTIEEFQAEKIINLELPISGQVIQWRMLDVDTEYKHRHRLTNTAKININTKLTLRNPQYNHKQGEKDAKPMWVVFNHQKADYLDVEALRKDITEKEGEVDTILLFPDPETPGKDIPVNLLDAAAFFFPSGVL